MTPEELKQYLKEHRLTQVKAAKKLGFCRQSISKYLSGKTAIPKKLSLLIWKKQNTTLSK